MHAELITGRKGTLTATVFYGSLLTSARLHISLTCWSPGHYFMVQVPAFIATILDTIFFLSL